MAIRFSFVKLWRDVKILKTILDENANCHQKIGMHNQFEKQNPALRVHPGGNQVDGSPPASVYGLFVGRKFEKVIAQFLKKLKNLKISNFSNFFAILIANHVKNRSNLKKNNFNDS